MSFCRACSSPRSSGSDSRLFRERSSRAGPRSPRTTPHRPPPAAPLFPTGRCSWSCSRHTSGGSSGPSPRFDRFRKPARPRALQDPPQPTAPGVHATAQRGVRRRLRSSIVLPPAPLLLLLLLLLLLPLLPLLLPELPEVLSHEFYSCGTL